jgi:hypothetical protein
MSDQHQYVVVLLSSSPCAGDPETRCVAEVYGPYSFEERATALASFPEGFTPHWMSLQSVRR